MEKYFTTLKFKAILLFALLFFVSSQVEATHFRYGTISWQITSSTATARTVQFNITQSWRWSAYGNPSIGSLANVGAFSFGDNTSANLSLQVTSINAAQDWFVGTQTLTKTYNITTDVTAFFSGCCRISSLQQGNNDLNYRTETIVTLSNPANRPPVGSTLPIFYVQTGLSNAQIQLNATDPDNDPLSFTVSTAAQSGLSTTTPAIVTGLSGSGLLSINTNAISIGRQYAMQVTVSDNKGARIPLDFIIQVVGVSNPPVFDYTVTPLNASTIKVQPGTPINFTVKARDVDAGSTVTLNSSGIPLGATLSPQSGTNPAQFTFSWTPTNANLGSYSLSFSATDNIFVQTLTNLNIVVSLAPIFNIPPTPPLLVHNVIAPGQNLSFTVQATDPDPLDVCSITEVNGKDMLNNKIPIYAGVTMSPALPTVLSNTTSSVYSWTPTQAQWGHKHAIFTAQDSYGDKTDHEVSILVNTNPQFTSSPVTSVVAGQIYQYSITTVDPDVPFGDDLALHTSVVLPAWLSLTDNGNGTGTLSGTPGIADAGTYNISLLVEDIYHHTNVGGIPTQTFTITVIPCLITISGTATDLSCAGNNSGAIDLTLTGNFGTPTFAWTGPNGYTAATEDISGLAAGSYTVVVSSDLGCTETKTFVVGTTPDITLPTAIAQNLTVQLDANGNASIMVYSVGAPSGTLPVQNSASVVTNQTYYAPSGFVAVGYEGFAGCITDNFRLICKPLNPDGTLGAAIAVTGFSGGGVTTPFTTSLTGDKILVGFNITDVDYLYAGTRIHSGVQGIGKSLAEIASGSANNANTTTLPGLNGLGCYSSNPATTTQYAPDGYAIVGMEVKTTSYSSAVKFKYAPISYVSLNNGSTDNCGIASIAASQTQFSCTDIGDNTVTLTVTDNSGNVSTTTATVTVKDEIPPVAIAQNVIVQLDNTGNGSTTAVLVDNGSTDACGISSMVLSKTAFTCADIATNPNTVTLTVTDNHGNVSTATATVTVKDEVPPVAIAQNVIVQLDNTGNGSTTAVLVDNGSSDACVISSMVLSKTTFTCADIATNPNTVTLTVTDSHGNVSTATATVTVKDEVPANVITQNITVQLDATGNVSIIAAQVDNGSSDACGIASLSVSPSSFTCSNVGDNTVTLTVTDVNGNVSSQTAVVKVEDNILPTWVTFAGSLNRSVSCGNAGTLAAAMALAPTATDNCTVSITKTTGTLLGNTITNTWSATDANSNTSSALFTQVITITTVTIDASGSSTPVALGSTATLYAQVTPAEAGISVTFKLDQGTVAYGTYASYTVTTNALGIATQTVAGLTVEVYRVYAIAGDGCANSTAYLAVYDPNGGFVTGGGWITSPLGAYVANPALTGKANFGFVSKYKKGSNVPDGNTEFQFHAGNLNFSSSSYSAGSLVIAGKQAIYKGVGTINGVSGYSFMVSAVDGQVSGGGGIDMFRMKIWNTSTSAIVYDNNISSAENATPSTALGGGSVVIHATSTKSATIGSDAANTIKPVTEYAVLKAYPNPFSDKLFFEFSREVDGKATLILFDGIGREISVLFDQQIYAKENYRIEYAPKGLSTDMLFYRMTFGNEVINGKVIFKK